MQRSSEALEVAPAFYKQFYKINRNPEGYNTKQETDVETETALFTKRFFNKFDDDYMRCLYELSLIQDQDAQIKRTTLGEDDFIQQELQRTIKHVKYAQSNFSMPHFAEILRTAKENHHRVFLIIPPHTKAYTKRLKKYNCIYFNLQDYLSDEVKLLNLLDSPLFDESDFIDLDHLNLKGAKKFTNAVQAFIQGK